MFVHEAFLKEDGPNESRKGVERKLDILSQLEDNLTMIQTELMEELGLIRKQVQKVKKN